MKANELQRILDPLVFAASQRTIPESYDDPWVYGWCVESHRRNSRSSIPHRRDRCVCLSAAAVRAYESAVARLLRFPPVTERWDADEIWGVVASLVGTAPLDGTEDDVRTFIGDRLGELLNVQSSVVALPVANVDWRSRPRAIGDLVIGNVGEDWTRLVEQALRASIVLTEDSPWWLKPSDAVEPNVGVAVRVPA